MDYRLRITALRYTALLQERDDPVRLNVPAAGWPHHTSRGEDRVQFHDPALHPVLLFSFPRRPARRVTSRGTAGVKPAAWLGRIPSPVGSRTDTSRRRAARWQRRAASARAGCSRPMLRLAVVGRATATDRPPACPGLVDDVPHCGHQFGVTAWLGKPGCRPAETTQVGLGRNLLKATPEGIQHCPAPP